MVKEKEQKQPMPPISAWAPARFRKCENCGKPFEISPDKNRTNRIYCKGSQCKLKAFRKRKAMEVSKPKPKKSTHKKGK